MPDTLPDLAATADALVAACRQPAPPPPAPVTIAVPPAVAALLRRLADDAYAWADRRAHDLAGSPSADDRAAAWRARQEASLALLARRACDAALADRPPARDAAIPPSAPVEAA